MTFYALHTALANVKGVGPKLAEHFAERELHTVRDLLLFVPLRYMDRSIYRHISELKLDEVVTVIGEVTASSNFYKGRRSIQSATIKDATGRLKLMWFNNPHIIQRMVKGRQVHVSGKLNDRGVMTQPTVEVITSPEVETIHTGRLVPVYSNIPGVAPATLRRILKEIIDHLSELHDPFVKIAAANVGPEKPLDLHTSITQLHFPDDEENIVASRERFAMEELLSLIAYSRQLKQDWQSKHNATAISVPKTSAEFVEAVTTKLPFTLTDDQAHSMYEILDDLKTSTPMNRLLMGDVGSGKTAVAGVACVAVARSGFHSVLVSPTQILAEQHFQKLKQLFPELHVQLITGKHTFDFAHIQALPPHVFIGTHAVLRHLDEIQPRLIIYDEQHRFGVGQRSLSHDLKITPHLLTLTATPIPRTWMLTLFSHLQVSQLTQMPAGRKEVITWSVPSSKRTDSYKWIAQELVKDEPNGKPGPHAKSQCLIVCPFIETSETPGLEEVASVATTFQTVKKAFPKNFRVGALHSQLKKEEQREITQKLYAGELDILVTTPIVEVGVDIPTATIIMIEAAERFGLASLHQLRGRVGRAGQQAYCLVFPSAKASKEAKQRLKQFSEIHQGLKLAELDLERRGAGDIFGVQQHGFEALQFASWSNLELIGKAQKYANLIEKTPSWQPFFQTKRGSDPSETRVPLAN